MDEFTRNRILLDLEEIRINFPAYNQAHSKLLNAIEDTRITQRPYGAVLCGWTGAGKTSLCLQIKSMFESNYELETNAEVRLCEPVMYFEVPNEVTVKGLARALLLEFGIEKPVGSGEEMTAQAIKLLKEKHVELVFLDEIQRLCIGAAKRIHVPTLGWITSFVNKLGKPVIICGTEECVKIRSYVGAFASRFPYQANLEYFTYDGNIHSEYSLMLQNLDLAIEQLIGCQNEDHLQTPSITAALFIATSGSLGWLKKILYIALKRCLSQNIHRGLTKEDFAFACDELTLEQSLTEANPFAFDLADNLRVISSPQAIAKLKLYRLAS
ncbi:TniB family NTP-binding protein [Pseudomonas sp. REP124]|uniref:TniB family NTP-binding protein n=1 Tax=Pseudomonas sp. REP124 TaxID=2875731 RepID=UPI001CCC6428|nr:TniB family NTP-binding protein [Pseudomonas sp. REP124]MBZ9783623.1 TniB family NTP-binding protein [Pseudomonas sp. REP124]